MSLSLFGASEFTLDEYEFEIFELLLWWCQLPIALSSFWACAVGNDGADDCTEELFSFEGVLLGGLLLSCFWMIVDTGEVAVALVVVMRIVEDVDKDEYWDELFELWP